MNTYRVRVRRNDLSSRVFVWDVDAKNPRHAISKALKNCATGVGNMDISVRRVRIGADPIGIESCDVRAVDIGRQPAAGIDE